MEAQDKDLWACLKDSLQASPDYGQSIISFLTGTAEVRLDPSTWGQQHPDVHFADSQQYPSLILPSQQLKSKTLLRSLDERKHLVELMDDLVPLEIPDYEAYLAKEISRVDVPFPEIGQISDLFFETVKEDLHPGIETVIYANHSVFTGKIDSIQFTYLNADLKNYSLSNAVDKTTLTKDVKDPLAKKEVFGDQLIDMAQFQDELEKAGANFLEQMTKSQVTAQCRLDQQIAGYDVKTGFQDYLTLQWNPQLNEFNQVWEKFAGQQNQKKQEDQAQMPQVQTKEDLGQTFQQDEQQIISTNDVRFISDMNDLQQQARQIAISNDIEDEIEPKDDEQDRYYDEQEDDEEGDDIEPFVQQVQFPGRQALEIQEQDPEIRKQIEQALQIKSKFKIIKSTEITKNQNRMNASTFKWAIEDESDMRNFYDLLPKAKMAKQYPFELDDFQKRSVLHLEKKESVFVCAHTSAGKTVVAEYAIALALKHNRRAIYTSPIKALSNQKFREFDTTFGEGNVGVVTGDVSIKPEASCLILTTEILRNMLYRGAELVRDIEWVIFDEVHYVNDQERGMVWEETIIMLPSHIGIIMLSATVPNHMDFANWVGRTKKTPIYVMKTFTRPVPLEHHLYLFDKFHMVKEKEGGFLSDEYYRLKKSIDVISAEARGKKEAKKKEMEEKKEDERYKNTSRSQRAKLQAKTIKARFITNVNSASMRFKDEKRGIVQLIRLCQKKELLPCVMFVFSKKKISELADAFVDTKGLKLIDHKAENSIVSFFDKALHHLKPDDRKCPQLLKLRELLRFGIAIHHGGLLPIAKEIVEILFSAGHIKVLLATETFAMGINMPTKTVIFHAIEKYDNDGLRSLHSSEYTQMSGRAGRRGLDEKGTVIIYVRDPQKLPTQMKLGSIIDHKGQELESKFRMTYRIILNLLTSKDLDAAEMMKRSYHENYRFIQLPRKIQQLERLRKDYVQYSLVSCPYQKGLQSGVRRAPIEDYVDLQKQFRHEQIEFVYGVVDQSKQTVTFPRYILFNDHQGEISLAVAINIELLNSQFLKRVYVLAPEQESFYKLTVLTVHSARDTPRSSYRFKKIQLTYQNTLKFTPKQLKGKQAGDYYYTINEIGEEDVLDFLTEQPTSTNRNSYMNTLDGSFEEFAQQLLEKQLQFSSMKEMLTQLYSIIAQGSAPKRKGQQQGLSRLKYKFNKATKQMIKGGGSTNEEDEQNYWRHRDDQIKEMTNSLCHYCDLKDQHLKQLSMKMKTKADLELIKQHLDAGDLEKQGDFQNKLLVLKRLGYIDAAGLPQIKARVAREIQDANSLYICELIVENILGDLSPSEIAAVVSAFVSQQRGKKSDEQDGQHYLEFQLQELEMDLNFKLSNALHSTYQLVKKVIQEESIQQIIIKVLLDAVESKDLGRQLRSTLDFTFCPSVHDWAKGGSFVDICYETKIEEGQIVMTIQRLDSLLRSMKNAFKVIGDMGMVEKIEKASYLVKKDIVFAQSLYFDPNATATAKK